MTTSAALAVMNEVAQDAIASLCDQFPNATAELLEQRQLLRRVDSKFVVPAADLSRLLSGMSASYAALRVPGSTWATYESLYFDTPDLRCFHDHRRGRRVRHKIRLRHYRERHVSFFEIKTKRNELITDKRRVEVGRADLLDADALTLARSAVGEIAAVLVPVAHIDYRRLTLIGLECAERVTIDLGLEVDTYGRRQRQALHGLVVVEVKQPGIASASRMLQRLAALGHRQRSLSKYTAAIARLYPNERRNRLLPTLRQLGDLIA